MSLQDWTNFAMVAVVLLLVFYVSLLDRIVRRQHEWMGRLTHRVWKLEGSPHCECQDCEVEA